MTSNTLNEMMQKAKIRKDGVCSIKGNLCIVKNGYIILYLDRGELFIPSGSFVVTRGMIKTGWIDGKYYDDRKAMQLIYNEHYKGKK